MRILFSLLALWLVAGMSPRDAHAYAACMDNEGWSPGRDVLLPPHPRILFFTDSREKYGRAGDDLVDFAPTATIGGKEVPVKVKVTKSPPYHFAMIEIDSPLNGVLIVKLRNGVAARYRISMLAKMPEEVPVTVGRFVHQIRRSSINETFHGLALHLPTKSPAIFAHVKLRRDDRAPWIELDVPVAAQDFDVRRTLVRLGELGCTRNYSVELLEKGVDIEVTFTLTDGSTRPATDLAAHVVLPAAT
jgi:hypothetical protein